MLISRKTSSGKRGILIRTEHFLTEESISYRLAISYSAPVLHSSCSIFFEPSDDDVRQLKEDAKEYFSNLTLAEAEKIIRQSVRMYGEGYGEEYREHEFVFPYARKFVKANFDLFSSLIF